jgi:transcriptional regulator with XRE-family HTH domain
MNKQELVERTRLIRKDVFKLTQSELAEAIGSSQVLVSRFELNGNGTIDFLLDLILFYASKGVSVNTLFAETFDPSKALDSKPETISLNITNIVETIRKELD